MIGNCLSKKKKFKTHTVIGIFAFLILIGQAGCGYKIASMRAEQASGDIVQKKKGRFLRYENERVLDEYPPHQLSLSMESVKPLKLRVKTEAVRKQTIVADEVFVEIGVREYYKEAFKMDDNVLYDFIDGFTLGTIGVLRGLAQPPTVINTTEEGIGEIKGEEKKSIRDFKEPLAGIPVVFSCGPAGQHKVISNNEGVADLNIEPLLNRLTKNFVWKVKATATYKGLSASDGLALDTSSLGVNWDKPRYQPDFPPKIVTAVSLVDPNNNQVLDANEESILKVTLRNVGKGGAFQIYVKPKITGKTEGVSISPAKGFQIENLDKGEEKTVNFVLQAYEEVPSQRFRVRILFSEVNGFEPPPLLVNLATQSYSPPQLILARWTLDDDIEGMSRGNGNRRIEHGEQAEITTFIQNRGEGSAKDVAVKLRVSDPNLYVKALSSDLGEIPPGEWRKAVFILRVNNRYQGPNELPIDLIISELRPKFSVSRSIDMPLGKSLVQEKETLFAGKQRHKPALEPVPLPKITRKQPLTLRDISSGVNYAILIGINNYIDGEIRSLQYAENDAKDLLNILTDPNIGKYKKENVFLMVPNSTVPQDRPTRLNILQTLKWMAENLKPEDSLLFAFCGHGETDKGINYLIPLDGRLSLPQDSSIRLSRLFEWLDSCPARRQIVMLDACHSGGTSLHNRGNRAITLVSKTFSKELNQIDIPRGRAVLASCSKEQVSYEDPTFNNGVFTYYVTEGLRNFKADSNNDKKVTAYELGNFVEREVKLWSKRHRKTPLQKPNLLYSDTSGEITLIGK